nr:hypothetical protein GCM10020185_32640 [Pseudomonas brassicacearum subsp. brassicacearum]
MELLSSFFSNIDWLEIWLATGDTFLMLFGSLLFTVLLGLPLGGCCCSCAARASCSKPVAFMRCCR